MRYKTSNLNHICCSGVAARPEVSTWYAPMTRSQAGREGPEHTQNYTILFLKDAHSQWKFDWLRQANWKSTNIATSSAQPRQHQNTHKAFSTRPNTPLPVWVEQHHLHTITNSHVDTFLLMIAPTYSIDRLGLRGKGQKSATARACPPTYTTSIGPTSRTPLRLKPHPNLDCIDTCTL